MTREIPPHLRLAAAGGRRLPRRSPDETRAALDVLRVRLALANLPSLDAAPVPQPGTRAALVHAAARLILRIEEIDARGGVA